MAPACGGPAVGVGRDRDVGNGRVGLGLAPGLGLAWRCFGATTTTKTTTGRLADNEGEKERMEWQGDHFLPAQVFPG